MISKVLSVTLGFSVREAKRRRHEFVGVEHILYGILNNSEGADIVAECGGNVEHLKELLEDFFKEKVVSISKDDEYVLQQTIGFQRVIQRAVNHVRAAEKSEVAVGDILASIFMEKDSLAAFFLSKEGITRLDVLNYISHELPHPESLEAIKIGNIMAYDKLSKEAKKVLSMAVKETEKRKNEYLHLEHLLYAMVTDNYGKSMIEFCGGNVDRLCKQTEEFLESIDKISKNSTDYTIGQTSGFKNVIQNANNYAANINKQGTGIDDLLIMLAQQKGDGAYKLLKKEGIGFPTILHDLYRFHTKGMVTPEKVHLFISYAKEDFQGAYEIYKLLKFHNLNPWIDEENLVPGQNWNSEINNAINDCDFFIACLSNNSVSKEGYYQKELKKGLDVFDQKPVNSIYLIPLRLEECKVPERFKDVHWCDFFKENGPLKLLNAVQLGCELRGISEKYEKS